MCVCLFGAGGSSALAFGTWVLRHRNSGCALVLGRVGLNFGVLKDEKADTTLWGPIKFCAQIERVPCIFLVCHAAPCFLQRGSVDA